MWRHVCHLVPGSMDRVPYFGICWHGGASAYLEAIKNGQSDDEATELAIAEFDDLWDTDLYETGQDGKDQNRNQKWAHRIFRQFRNSPTRLRYSPEQSESYFERELIDGVLWCGRRDTTGQDKKLDVPGGVDFKTHGFKIPAFTRTDLISPQFQMYMWLDDRKIWFVEHVAGATKWEQEGRSGGEPLPEGVAFVTSVIEPKPFLVEELKLEVAEFRDNVRRWTENGQMFPKNAPYACSYWNKPCEYLDLCEYGVKVEPDWTVKDPLATHFRREKWDPKKDSKSLMRNGRNGEKA